MKVTEVAIRDFIWKEMNPEEKEELQKILKCTDGLEGRESANEIVEQIYRYYQTPVGFIMSTPTLDEMCDRIAKKFKTRPLTGIGWTRLASLSINIFEKVLKSMSEEEKHDLLKKLWDNLDDKQREKLTKEFNIKDFHTLLHSSEFLVAHVFGVFLAREVTLLAAASLLKAFAGSEAALLSSRFLSRGIAIALGPIGWGLLGLSLNDFVGTNFKKVLPALLILNAARAGLYPVPEELMSDCNTSPDSPLS